METQNYIKSIIFNSFEDGESGKLVSLDNHSILFLREMSINKVIETEDGVILLDSYNMFFCLPVEFTGVFTNNSFIKIKLGYLEVANNGVLKEEWIYSISDLIKIKGTIIIKRHGISKYTATVTVGDTVKTYKVNKIDQNLFNLEKETV